MRRQLDPIAKRLGGTFSPTDKQFFRLITCDSCLQYIQEEYLFCNPENAYLFEDLLKANEDQKKELKGCVSYVLRHSDHRVNFYPGQFDQDCNYMTIVGFRGIYMAYNDDVDIFFDTLKMANKYAAEGYKIFKQLFS